MEEFFNQLKKFLDSVPMGTLIALAGIGCILYAYITGSINITQAFEYLGYTAGGSAAVGAMRTYSGKGL